MNAGLVTELRRDAARYIWWEPPDEVLKRPNRVLAQVMNIGDYDDVQRLAGIAGEDALKETLLHAEAGWFDERSWTYWCYRLGIVKAGEPIPTLPTRSFF